MKRQVKRLRKVAYQIDQSGKIEQTNRATVIALSNGKTIVVKISAVEKQKLIETLKEIRKPNKTYFYDIFAALIFIALDQYAIPAVEIDKEYPGHEGGVKERLIQFFDRMEKKSPEIDFGLVGKKSSAHLLASSVFQEEKKPNLVVKAEDILKIIFGSKKSWRPRSGRGNP